MHYSPTVTTLGNEPPLKYWMLGNSLLGKVIDDHQVDLVLHGHAHLGNYEGQTLGGVPVRNVAAHVTGKPMIFDIHAGGTIVDIGNGESLLAGPVRELAPEGLVSSAFQAISGAATTARPLVRLDLVANPYGPVDPIIDAVSRFDGWGQSFERHATRLRARLGALAGVNDDWVVLANGIDELHAMIAQWRNDHGPLVLFPPSDPGLERWLGATAIRSKPSTASADSAFPSRLGN